MLCETLKLISGGRWIVNVIKFNENRCLYVSLSVVIDHESGNKAAESWIRFQAELICLEYYSLSHPKPV